MKKQKWILMVMVLAMVFAGQVFAQTQSDEETPLKQEYFDNQFDKLQMAVGEVKGDTEQIKGILGTVFEGTVPKGSNLTRLCNESGWNILVLMGHNGIANPNNVAAGSVFTYPQTAEELQLALKKGKPLYDAWLKTQKTTFRVNKIQADTVELGELRVKVMNVTEELKIKNMTIDQLKVRLVDIEEELRIKRVEIGQLNVEQANLEQVNIDQLNVKDAKIKNLEIENLRIYNALIDKLRIKQLEIDNLQALLDQACARLDAEKARGDELAARPPVIEEVIVSVTPDMKFRVESDCGKPFRPKGWERKVISIMQEKGLMPLFTYINIQPNGDLKQNFDYFDETVNGPNQELRIDCWRFYDEYNPSMMTPEDYREMVVDTASRMGYTLGEEIPINDGGKYKTVVVFEVLNWPDRIIVN